MSNKTQGMNSGYWRVASPAPWKHPSYRPVRNLVEALQEFGWTPIRRSDAGGRVLDRAGVGRLIQRPGVTIVPLMGPLWRHLAVFGVDSTIIPFCWDVWEPDLLAWRRRLSRYELRTLICTSSEAAQMLSDSLDLECHFVPEAIDPEDFNATTPLTSRTINVLELGRRHEGFHNIVSSHLAFANRTHLYQNSRGLIFRDELELRCALSRTQIGVCFPGSSTHPDRCGSIETVTQRYFEFMAAGALILGHAPRELVALCKYNPVIEVDWRAPTQQLGSILDDIAAFQPLVDRNLDWVRHHATWTVRAQQVSAIAKAQGIEG